MFRFFSVVFASLLTLAIAGTAVAAAQAPVNLGTAESFGVLSGSAVTNTGPSVINGDLGVSPGTAISGFPPGTVNGTVYAADAVAGQAKSDLTTAYNDAAGRSPATSLPPDAGGLSLTPGVYSAPSTLGLTGALTLNAQGDPNAVFIFQIGSALTTATDSSVLLTNGAQACNVYWQVSSDATLGTRTAFQGTILAATSITADDAVTVDGRLLAGTGAVTLINDTISRARCAQATVPGDTPAPDGGTTAPGTTPGNTPGTTPGTTPDDGPDAGPGQGNGRGPGRSVDRWAPRIRIYGVPGTPNGTPRPRGLAICTTRNFTARVRLRDGSGIRRVKVYLDGRLVRRTTRRRFSLRISVRGLRVGRHTLRVMVRDRAGNLRVARRSFRRCALPLVAPRFTG